MLHVKNYHGLIFKDGPPSLMRLSIDEILLNSEMKGKLTR